MTQIKTYYNINFNSFTLFIFFNKNKNMTVIFSFRDIFYECKGIDQNFKLRFLNENKDKL